MTAIAKLICFILTFWLVLAPAHSAVSTKAKADAKPGVTTSAKAKAKLKAKAKSKAKSKSKSKSKATQTSHTISSVRTSGFYPPDESSLDAEVAVSRRILAANPRDVGARVRLARAAVALIDLLLDAEAVGNSIKAERLSRKLREDLHDTGWRIQKMSQKGDLRASQASGFLLGRGILLQKDAEKSCTEFLAAAEQFAPAAWHAAQCLMETSSDKAWVLMDRAAGRGHATAQEWMGRRCLGEFGAKEKDFACARAYLAQSASQGRSRAQTLLAYLLMNGQGGPVDVSRATRLYKLAAEQGDADAQNNLGEIHEMGRGTTANLDEALTWYERAAARGLGSAQFNAGRLWAVGVGDRKDPAKARALLVQAEANGVAQARQVLEWLDRQSPPAPDASAEKAPAASNSQF
ncbi:MAG: tetratricopeptide repeat protein [Sulfuritalea sp.]|nr:tetratricopeptide repeat protein [Sulfuritalea sp.]